MSQLETHAKGVRFYLKFPKPKYNDSEQSIHPGRQAGAAEQAAEPQVSINMSNIVRVTASKHTVI